jgi:hypothetical protein
MILLWATKPGGLLDSPHHPLNSPLPAEISLGWIRVCCQPVVISAGVAPIAELLRDEANRREADPYYNQPR